MTNIELPDNYTPSEEEEYMNDKQLAYFKNQLIVWKKELLSESSETINHLKEENLKEPDITDRANIELETAIELRTRNRYKKLIDKIDQALKRIETKQYGYCESTGEEIGIKRLIARPVATLCIEAQEKHENYEKSYKEEKSVRIE